ncbi:MAG: HAD-IIA family hydrolase [Acutalibacter sp.]|nr:HAD-IIA family hydrolase [Acutalibacter sp.]
MDRDALSARLKKIKMFVLDMDGTIYLGNSIFPFTLRFLEQVKHVGKEFCFFTNNSSKNREAYLQKLERMGISIPPEKMMISNGVILEWLLRNHPGERCYVVGTPLLEQDFLNAGIELDDVAPDYVVLGFDTTLTYEKLSKACAFIRAGKPVFGVNPDFNCPVENGFIPDCGSIAALVKASTGVQCEFFGKPSPHTLSYLLEHTGCRPEELAVIGDRLYTDIAVADGTEVTSILVMSGETTTDLLESSEVKPDLVVHDLEELTKLL